MSIWWPPHRTKCWVCASTWIQALRELGFCICENFFFRRRNWSQVRAKLFNLINVNLKSRYSKWDSYIKLTLQFFSLFRSLQCHAHISESSCIPSCHLIFFLTSLYLEKLVTNTRHLNVISGVNHWIHEIHYTWMFLDVSCMQIISNKLRYTSLQLPES